MGGHALIVGRDRRPCRRGARRRPYAVPVPTTLASALRRAGRVGPYFDVDTERRGDGWRPLADLTSDAAVLRAQVSATRAALADRCATGCDDVDERAAASVYLLGLAARLVSPVLATAALGGVVPVLDPRTVHWQVREGGPLGLALTPGAAATGDGAPELAALVHRHLVEPVLAPLVDLARAEFRTSPRVLWGDVASAVGGAVTVLAQAEPTRAQRASAVAAAVLAGGVLAGTARVRGRAPFLLARNSCCLYYRVPGGGTCGDCVLVHPPRAQR